MKTTQVEMPDGTLMTIQGGGDAESVAGLIMQKLEHTKLQPMVSNEQALEMPPMNFGDQQQRSNATQARQPVANLEEPLALPSLV